MKPFDFNVHLPSVGGRPTVASETAATCEDLDLRYVANRESIRKHVSSLNVMLLCPNLADSENGFSTVSDRVKHDFPQATFTLMIDFRSPRMTKMVASAAKGGACGVKFHSYVQRIGMSDFSAVVVAAEAAQAQGLWVCLDTSYGTSRMYDYDNLRLAGVLAEHVTDVPLILLHSGGARLMEAMLLAEERENVFLETSFSLPYYAGSSLDGDLAFAMRKIGCRRVLYGSDFPYVSFERSMGATEAFLDRHEFTGDERANILGCNARRLLKHV